MEAIRSEKYDEHLKAREFEEGDVFWQDLVRKLLIRDRKYRLSVESKFVVGISSR